MEKKLFLSTIYLEYVCIAFAQLLHCVQYVFFNQDAKIQSLKLIWNSFALRLFCISTSVRNLIIARLFRNLLKKRSFHFISSVLCMICQCFWIQAVGTLSAINFWQQCTFACVCPMSALTIQDTHFDGGYFTFEEEQKTEWSLSFLGYIVILSNKKLLMIIKIDYGNKMCNL